VNVQAKSKHLVVETAPLNIGRFARHYLEMIGVMLVAMALLGAIVSGIFAVIGHANLYHYAGFRAAIMSVNMTIGMIIWMRFRGHAWHSTLEMAVAMMLPFVLLIGPYRADLIDPAFLLIGLHALMLPFMGIAMLFRYPEYAREMSHRGRPLARFNRRVANPAMRLIAGRVRPFALVTHEGRRTGRLYRTPACAFPTSDGLVFAVLYGSRSDWVLNVLAGRGASIERSRARRTYSEPRLLTRDEGLQLLSRPYAVAFRLLRVRSFLRVSEEVGDEGRRPVARAG
jgi:deazaflavin-dependent oxidoreductase (nitroreductase family)